MRKFYLFIFVTLFAYMQVQAQIQYIPKGDWKIYGDLEYGTSSSLYDLEGKQRILERDTFNIIINKDQPYSYFLKHTFEMKEYVFKPRIEYAISDGFSVFAKCPLVYLSYLNTYTKDTNRFSPTYGRKITRAEHSTFFPAYYELGSFIRLNKGALSTSLLLGVQLPQKLKNGFQQDTLNNFHIYNAFKYYLGLVATLKMETSFLELETKYIQRTGNFDNRLHLRLEGGFSSVPNTALKGICIYDISLSGFDNALPANPRRTTLQEDAIAVGASFGTTFNDRINIELAYLISIGIKNTLNFGRLQINTSVLLD